MFVVCLFIYYFYKGMPIGLEMKHFVVVVVVAVAVVVVVVVVVVVAIVSFPCYIFVFSMHFVD